MRLVVIASDVYEIAAYMDHRGRSPVIDELHGRKIKDELKARAWDNLCDYWPTSGPPRHNKQKARWFDATEGLAEMKVGQLRVLFFEDGNRLVFTDTCIKKAATLPKRERQRLADHQKDYRASQHHCITLEDYWRQRNA